MDAICRIRQPDALWFQRCTATLHTCTISRVHAPPKSREVLARTRLVVKFYHQSNPVFMIMIAAALVLSVDAAMSVPRISPLFSWSTLPVAFHSSSSHSLFTSAQISELARYAMVTLEKYHDIDNVAPHATLIPPYTASTYALLIYPRCWCISRRPAATARCHCAYIDVHICCPKPLWFI